MENEIDGTQEAVAVEEVDVIMAPRVTPARRHFFVVRDGADRFTSEGIELPNPERKKTGTVVAVGDGCPDHIRPGIRLTWCQEMLQDIEVDGQELIVMTETDRSCTYVGILPDCREVE